MTITKKDIRESVQVLNARLKHITMMNSKQLKDAYEHVFPSGPKCPQKVMRHALCRYVLSICFPLHWYD